MEIIKSGYSNWSKLNGRTSREEYWTFFIYVFVMNLLLIWFFPEQEALISVWLLIHLVINIGLLIRRMHDVGAAGYWCIVPIIGIIFALSASKTEENKWGKNPKDKGGKTNNTEIETKSTEKIQQHKTNTDSEKNTLNHEEKTKSTQTPETPEYLKTESEKWEEEKDRNAKNQKETDRELINSSKTLQEMEKRIIELEELISNRKKVLDNENAEKTKKIELEKQIKSLEEELSKYE
jgi:uncharacterized membrane protein YhaH (DUF805 family)